MNTLIFFISLFVGLALFQLVLLVYLAVKKIRTVKKQQHEQRIYKQAMPKLIDYLYNNETDYIPLPPEEYHVAEQLFSDCLSTVKDKELQRIIYASASSFLSSHYEKVMNTGDWPSRVNALYYMEDFRMKSMQPILVRKLNEAKTQDEEKQQLIRTLAAIGDVSVLSFLENDPTSTESMFLSVYSRFPEDIISQTVDYVNHEGSIKATISLLMYFGFAKNLSYLPFVEEKLVHDNPEMRIQSLKAIFRMNYLSDATLLIPFLHSENWVERMFATKITGTLALSQFEHELTDLLGDKVWWVRYYAADALLLSLGESKLFTLSQNHPDQYARNMATQWLTLGRQVTYSG